MAELQDYSTTAGSNNSASPNGWPEGMSPSGLNDSDRELAARIARERDDTQGVTATGGSSNAYTFAAVRGTTAAYTGEMFVFRANHTNTGAATLNVTPSGGSARGAVAIQSGGAALAGNEITSGGVYGVVYDGTQYQLIGGNPVLNALSSVMSSTATAAAQRNAIEAGKGWDFIESQTASASSSLDFTTGVDSTYDLYKLVITNLLPATDGANLHLRFTVSGTPRSTAGDYEYNNIVLLSSAAGVTAHGNSQGATFIQCALGISNVATEAAGGVIYFSAPSTGTFHKAWGDVVYLDSSGTALFSRAIFGGVLNGTSGAIDGAQILLSSGNITSGTVALYGLRK